MATAVLRSAPAGVAAAPAEAWWLEWAALAVLAATVLFNMALSYVDAHGRDLTPGILVGVQGLLLGAAFAVGLWRARPADRVWLAVLWGFFVWWLALSLVRGVPNPKYLGDVAAFPIFALLGVKVRARSYLWLLVVLQVLIVAVGLWEALRPDSYASMLNVAKYYTNTRGVTADDASADASGLYLNASRPEGRLLLPSLGWHRISSVFLEPVSLGNWTVVVTVFLCSFWRRMSWPMRGLLIAGNLLALVMCDGRFAILCNAVVIAAALVAARLPRWLPLLFPAAMFAALAAGRALGVLTEGGDTLKGRLLKGLFYFERMSLSQLFGLNAYVPGNTFDSGWTYFSETQSILGFAAFWVALVLLLPARTVEAKRFLFGLTVFFTLSMPISNAFLSIKAAALLFACYGALRRWETERDGAVAPSRGATRPPFGLARGPA